VKRNLLIRKDHQVSMEKKALKALIILGVVGSSLMLISFMLPQVSVTILDRDYSASGFNLVEGKMVDEYRADVGGNHFVLLPHGFPAFPTYFLLLLFSALALPLPFFRDALFRFLGIIFAVLGMVGAVYGYMRFTEAAASEPTWTVGIGYGLIVALVGGILIVIANAVKLYLGLRRGKPAITEE
jgi:hypothetical protein